MTFGRQFWALLRKNLLLQTRARKSWLGLTSWGALAVEILLPVAFFLILWLPRYFLPLPRPTLVRAPRQLFCADTFHTLEICPRCTWTNLRVHHCAGATELSFCSGGDNEQTLKLDSYMTW